MSELPTIDSFKVATRELDKLRTQVAESTHREAQLEILAETLRDERDVAIAALASESASAKQQAPVNPVHNITSLSDSAE